MNPNSHVRYDRHQDEWNRVLNDEARSRCGNSWLEKDTLDSWRHARMRVPLLTFVRANPDASWLTVGDGRFGTDANYLLLAGARNVHCSDVSDTLLKIGSEKGFINAYSAENAEFLSFADNSFDYVYCKEALHHFPRPFVALAEMFRVARCAVVLTEPRDHVIDRAPFACVIDALRWLRRGDASAHTFETVGNYAYALSEREIEKFLLGMHYTKAAFTGCNDAYVAGVEYVKLGSPSASDRKKIVGLKAKILLQDFLERVGLRKSALLTAALFKDAPAEPLEAALRKSGWRIRNLPKNPYL